MSSLVSLVASHGPIMFGQGEAGHPDEAVRAAQMALSQAGYRIGANGAYDGIFGPGTRLTVERFQRQHGLTDDGKIGPETAAELDRPHDQLVAGAAPTLKQVAVPGGAAPFPHDDTASLVAFYGKPWEDQSLLVDVPVPFLLRYIEGAKVSNFSKVRFHRKAADRLEAAFMAVWSLYGMSQDRLDHLHLSWFSGTYNYRAVRGSSRLSTHAFGAAVDLDAEDYPLGSVKKLPEGFVACFTGQGFFWGGNYTGRKDPMHFQAAHE